MAEQLSFEINAIDNATPVMERIQAEKEGLDTPIVIPVEAPGLVDTEFTMKSLAIQQQQLAAAGGSGFGAIAQESEAAAEGITAVGSASTATALPLYRLAQVGAGTGVAFGGITDRAVAAAASLAIMGGPLAAVAIGVGATILGLDALSAALGQTQKASEDQQKLIAAIGVDGAQTIVQFSQRIQDLQNDVKSIGNDFGNIAKFIGDAIGDKQLSDIAAARKGLQEFNDVVKASPGAALILAETLNQFAAAGQLSGNAAQLTAEQLKKMNDQMVALVQASGTEAVDQQVLKDAIGEVTAARLLGLDVQQKSGEQIQDYITRITAEVEALKTIPAATAQAAAATAEATSVRETAAAIYDVATAAELRGIDAHNQTAAALGNEIQGWINVNALMEQNIEATTAAKQASDANNALATSRLEAAQLGLDATRLGADATNELILANRDLTAQGQEFVQSAALESAAKKQLADDTALWTKAIEDGLNPMQLSNTQLTESVAILDNGKKATEGLAAAETTLAIQTGRVTDGLDSSTQSLLDAAGATELQVQNTQDLIDQNKKLIDSLDQLPDKWTKVRDSVGGVEGDAQAFANAWKTATEQVFGQADTIDNFGVALGNLTKREKDHGATLDLNNLEGAKQLTLVEKLRETIGTDLAEAYRNSGGSQQAMLDEAQRLSKFLSDNLPKDLDTSTKGLQGWQQEIGDIPTLVQTSLQIAVQQESLDKLKQVSDTIALLPPQIQAQVKVAMGTDATKAVEFFDYLTLIEKNKHDIPVDAQLKVNQDLISGNFADIQAIFDAAGKHIEMPSILKNPVPLTDQQVQDITGQQPTVPLSTNLAPPPPAVVPPQAPVTIPAFIEPVPGGGVNLTDKLDLNSFIELPPGVDLTQGKGITVPFNPAVNQLELDATGASLDGIAKDPNHPGQDRTAAIVPTVPDKDAQAAKDKINGIATNDGKGYTATINVVPPLTPGGGALPGGGDVSKPPRSAPTQVVNVTQHITAGFGTNLMDLEKTIKKANHKLNRLAGIRA